jgi:hypothetical protein
MIQRDLFQTVTSLQQDTHVNPSASQVSAKEMKILATSGRSSLELLHPNDQLGVFSKMFMVTSHWASTKCCLTWRQKATPQGRLLFQLVVSIYKDRALRDWPETIADIFVEITYAEDQYDGVSNDTNKDFTSVADALTYIRIHYMELEND